MPVSILTSVSYSQQLQEYVRRGRAGKLTDALEMRNGCEAKIQAKKEEKEGLEGKQKANDEQILGQDASKRNIEVIAFWL